MESASLDKMVGKNMLTEEASALLEVVVESAATREAADRRAHRKILVCIVKTLIPLKEKYGVERGVMDYVFSRRSEGSLDLWMVRNRILILKFLGSLGKSHIFIELRLYNSYGELVGLTAAIRK